MTRRTSQYIARYKPLVELYIGCKFCGSQQKLKPLYHPRELSPGEVGVSLKSCVSCYSSYRLLELFQVTFHDVFNRLTDRQRRYRGVRRVNTSNPEFQRKWNLADIQYSIGDKGEVLGAWDDEVSNYHVNDLEKFFKIRHELIDLNVEQLKARCNEEFHDQRFINKVVYIFSS